MRISTLPILLATAAAGVLAASSRPLAADEQLAEGAYQVLKRHCYRCHGTKFEVAGLNVLDRESLTRKRVNEPSYVEPGKLQESYLWNRVGEEGDMPPAKVEQRPTPEEVVLLRRWIEAGAPFPRAPESRGFLSEVKILESIRGFLQDLDPADHRHQRFFSLAHLYNNSGVNDDDLRLYRAAFSKAVNSLSRNSRIVVPKTIEGTLETVFVVDLRDYGWDDLDLWEKVVQQYPYAVLWNDPRRQNLAQNIERLIGDVDFDGFPYFRADWFVVKATRPPLYHDLLDLPDTDAELEEDLRVDVESDFRKNDMLRAAFSRSGVSRHNRLVDRHVGGNTQYYYKSVDFDSSTGRAILFRFPLGPEFNGNEFNQFAFDHAGGEIIYRLPNGLQGYFVVDDQGQRIDKAPVEIVRDLNETSGTPVVVNGVSCMGCHRAGIQEYRDNVKQSMALTGEARAKIDRLYASNDELERVLSQDREDYLRALEQAIGPILRSAGDSRSIAEFPEPVSAVARLYDKNVDLETAARELGLENIDELRFAIRGNREMLSLGLGPLANEETIPREMWDTEESEGLAPIFQRAVRSLGLGTGVSN